tara:strand:- start:1710 stop:2270 length:561 start_codon:yes stop_codon:yes gene_type:complete
MRLLLLAFLCTTALNAQKFTITPDGLKDFYNQENNYLVLEIEDKSAETLYQSAKRYILETYKNPKEVLKADVENDFIRFTTYAPNVAEVNNVGAKFPVNGTYSTELRFKDNRVKFDILDLTLNVENGYSATLEYQGSTWSGFVFFNKKGKVSQGEAKSQLEQHFSNRIEQLKSFLEGKVEEQNNDW